MKRAAVVHDIANLLFLPILCAFAIVGLVWQQVYQTFFVYVILGYVAVDTVWVFAIPDAVPSALTLIRVHHVITLLLCLFPLLRPSLAVYACLDGLTEINTFFLIARRQWKSQRQILTACYWSTFIPVRLVLFPYLLVVFAHHLPRSVPLWERSVILGCQLFLCVFNVGMTLRSLTGWWRNQQKAATAANADKPGAAASAAAQPPVIPQLLQAGWPAAATAHIVIGSSGSSLKPKANGQIALPGASIRNRTTMRSIAEECWPTAADAARSTAAASARSQRATVRWPATAAAKVSASAPAAAQQRQTAAGSGSDAAAAVELELLQQPTPAFAPTRQLIRAC